MLKRFFMVMTLATSFSLSAFAAEYRCEGSCNVDRVDTLSCAGGAPVCNETCYSCQRMGLQCLALGGGYVGCKFQRKNSYPMASSDVNLSVAQTKIYDQCRLRQHQETGYWGAPNVSGLNCKEYRNR